MRATSLLLAIGTLSACVAPTGDLGARTEAAAGAAKGGQRWPDHHVRYYLDSTITTSYSGSLPACSANGGVAPCGRSMAERIQLAAARYTSVTSLHFDAEPGRPDLDDPSPHVLYARVAGASSHTYSYTALREAYLDWRDRCWCLGHLDVHCDIDVYPEDCDPSRPSQTEQIAWLYVRDGHNTYLRPRSSARWDHHNDDETSVAEDYAASADPPLTSTLPEAQDDSLIVLKQSMTEPTDDSWMLRHPGALDPGWSHVPLHETGHALGMMHEQERVDSSDHIWFFSCNLASSIPACSPDSDPPSACAVDPHNANEDAFATHAATPLAPYNFYSVMQYPSTTKSNNEDYNPTMLSMELVPGAAEPRNYDPYYEGGSYTVRCPDDVSHMGYWIEPDGGLSPEDINILYQFYPPQLGTNEPDDVFGTAMASGDFDHDGYEDLAIGAPGECPNSLPCSGSVYVFKGTYDGLVPWHRLDEPGSAADDGDLFGSALAAGDIDGDGDDDLVVGAPYALGSGIVQSGRAFVYLGGERGPRYSRAIDPSTGPFPEAPALWHSRFGASVAIGELDGTSAGREIAVGAPSHNVVYVFRNNGTKSRSLSGSGTFGAVLAAGRLDNDTADDLAITASSGAGAVYVWRSTLASSAPQRLDEPVTGTANSSTDRFGASLAIGRFGANDAVQELVIGAPGHNSERGRVYVMSYRFFAGTPYSYFGWRLDQTLRRSDLPNSCGLSSCGDVAHAQFGASLATGDRASGADDLVIGAPGDSAVDGLAVYYRGTGTTTPQLGSASTLAQPSTSDPGEHFGSAVAAGDFNHRNTMSAAVSAPAKFADRGVVWVARGSSSSPPSFPSSSADQLAFATYLDQENQFYSHWSP